MLRICLSFLRENEVDIARAPAPEAGPGEEPDPVGGRVAVARLAVLSMHTSPLAQPGTGDGGGMNVYVRELASALARLGVACEVFTRADDPALPETISVEPGFRVHHVRAGPVTPVPKESLPDLVAWWTAGVGDRLARLDASGSPVDAIHANYWLSGMAGHTLKHELNLPLLVTFHTLDRVKADASPEELFASEPARRPRRKLRSWDAPTPSWRRAAWRPLSWCSFTELIRSA